MRNEEFWCPAEPDGFKSFRLRRNTLIPNS